MHNVQVWIDPNSLFYQQTGYQIDPKTIKLLDGGTLRVRLKDPKAHVDQDLTYYWGSIKSRNEKKGGRPAVLRIGTDGHTRHRRVAARQERPVPELLHADRYRTLH